MLETLEARFRALLPDDVDHCSFRYQSERTERLSVRQDIVQPVHADDDAGAMVTVVADGGVGYGATSDLSERGLARALEAARTWAARTAGRLAFQVQRFPALHPRGEYASAVESPWSSVSFAEKLDLLRERCKRLHPDPRIVDWSAGLAHMDHDALTVTSGGGRLVQRFSYVFPSLRATANEGSVTQTRTLGAGARCRQGGFEMVEASGFCDQAERIAEQALELLSAPECPEGTMDVLLSPDQMVLQIHESIGHPLELDRILGDERNYAGTSFVTPEMFGSYRYGSDLLNVTFDPTVTSQLASYGFDDAGTKAERAFIIKDGILERPLGGALSQARAGLPGVANTRACSWNRPPIDRMANLNLESGESRFEDMLRATGRGVYMQTNRSWSIDDSRNKFQFGCEYARRIEAGELKEVVRNPCYRGISATFWRNLAMVGDRSTFEVMGTPNCGKGEPNQVVRVGHASPACRFRNVEVFGGA